MNKFNILGHFFNNLFGRLDAVMEEARGRIEAFQKEAESTRQAIGERFQKFLPIAERIVAIAREKLERLRERLNFDVTPSQFQTTSSARRRVASSRSDMA
jgi:hypothetical protein